MRATSGALLERSIDLETIEAAIRRAADGTGSVVLIEGEAGIGKTELLRAAKHVATEAGMTVLAARASELEGDYAHGVTRQLFQLPLADLSPDERSQALSGAAALAASLLDVADAGPERSSSQDAFALLHGLHWLCANLAFTQPLMLGIDDLQWADLASARFVHYLAGRIAELPVVVVATLRTGESGASAELLAELRDQQSAERLRPGALSLDATVSYVRARLGHEAALEFCDACHRATGGNPLFLTELARAVVVEGLSPTAAEAGRVAEIGGRSVADRVLSRVARLGADGPLVARAVAILEPHATVRRVAATASLSRGAAANMAHRLVEAGVLRDSDPLRFSHPLLRSAVESGMTDPERQDLHAAAARVHRVEDEDPGLIAAHIVKTHTIDEPWVVEALRAAAEQALARGAPDLAAAFLRRGLQEPVQEHERIELLRALGSALLRTGDAEGIAWMRRARDAADDPVFRARIVAELGPSLIARTRSDELIALAYESIAELSGIDMEIELLLRAVIVSTAAGGNGSAFGESYDELRNAAGDLDGRSLDQRIAFQFLAFGGALGRETAPATRRLALQALGDEEAFRAAAAVGRPLQFAVLALAASGQPQLALRRTEIGTEEMRRRASLFGVTSSLFTQAGIRLSCGDITGASVDAEEAWSLAAATVPMLAAGTAGIRGAIALEQGRITEAAQALAAAPGSGGGRPAMFTALVPATRGRLRLAQGRPEEALTDLETVAAMFDHLGILGPDLLPPRLHVPLALFALGRNRAAVQTAESGQRWAGELQNARLVGEAARVRGLVDGTAGAEALREAVEILAGTEYRLDHARALVDLGSTLRRANERRASREPLREGMELAHRCGASALEQRARTELEATGARPRRIVLTGVESLTPSERRIAELAAKGMTNREIAQTLFVTRKTVETHLRHCYQKLDITGRGALPGALKAPPAHDRRGGRCVFVRPLPGIGEGLASGED